MEALEEKLFELIEVASEVRSCPRFFKSCGVLTPAEGRILEILGQQGKISGGAMARSLSMSNSAVSQFVDKLVKKKFVKREYEKNDRRVVYNVLTDGGKNALEKHATCKEGLIKNFIKEIKGIDRETASFMLNVLLKVFKEHLTEIKR